MRRIIGWLIAGLLFPLVTAAETTQKALSVYPEDKRVIMITQDQPMFVIKLKSNPTTGYSWFLRRIDASLIEPVKETFVAPTDKHLVGAPGYELWTFRVKPAAFSVPRVTKIRFEYVRPWEPEESKPQEVSFKVSIFGGSKPKTQE